MSIKRGLAGGACTLSLVVASFFGIVTDKVRISPEGLENLINCEGCKLNAYKDVAGVPTVGVGATVGVVFGRLYTDGEVAKLLARDVMIAETCLVRNAPTKYTQGEWDSYVSFVFNVGCSAFVSSTSYKILMGKKPGTRYQACEAMRMWNKITVNGRKVVSPGLVNRRDKDVALCVKYL